jgi:hypothetical protein
MRKNLAPVEWDFHHATVQVSAHETCPQFLWINLCGISLLCAKSLILLEEILAMKILAAQKRCSSTPVESASAQFLWTKLCASAHILLKSLIYKGKDSEPVF